MKQDLNANAHSEGHSVGETEVPMLGGSPSRAALKSREDGEDANCQGLFLYLVILYLGADIYYYYYISIGYVLV